MRTASFTKTLSREVAKHNVLVNCVAPGPLDTEMIRNLGAKVVAQMVSDSDASRFNTGAVFDMSGGRDAHQTALATAGQLR